MKSLLVFVASCLCLMTLASCGGGGGHVGPPVILSLTPASLNGPSNTVFALQLELEGEATSHQWTFGDGIYPASSTAASPTIRLTRPGSYDLEVVVSNEAGASEPLVVSYTVAALPNPVFEVGEAPGRFAETVTSFKGRPVGLTDTSEAFDGMFIAAATSGIPRNSADWSEYQLTPDAEAIGKPVLLSTEDEIFTVFKTPADEVKLAVARVFPATLNAWSFATIRPDLDAEQLYMIEWQERLMLFAGTTDGWVFLLSNDLSPTGPADWSALEEPGFMQESPIISILNPRGKIELLAGSSAEASARCYFSTSAPMPSPEDWTRSAIDISPTGTSLALFQSPGKTFAVLATRHQNPDLTHFFDPIHIAVAHSEMPVGAGQWTAYDLSVDDARGISCQIIDDRPLILYSTQPTASPGSGGFQGDQKLVGYRAITPEPLLSVDWVQSDIVTDTRLRVFGVAGLGIEGGISVYPDDRNLTTQTLRTESLW